MSAPYNRRSLLRGLTAVTVATSGGAVALTVAAQTAPAENTDLIKLGGQLDTLAAAYGLICEAKTQCVARFASIEPKIPKLCILDRRSGIYQRGEGVPDEDGIPKISARNSHARLVSRDEAAEWVKRTDGRTVVGKRCRQVEKAVEGYHKAHEAARLEVGLPAIEESRFYKGREVLKVGFAIAGIEARTFAGLSVKGRAGLAMHQVWADEGRIRIDNSYEKLLNNLAALGDAEVRGCA